MELVVHVIYSISLRLKDASLYVLEKKIWKLCLIALLYGHSFCLICHFYQKYARTSRTIYMGIITVGLYVLHKRHTSCRIFLKIMHLLFTSLIFI